MIRMNHPDGALPHLMKNVLGRLRQYETLSYDEAKEALSGITTGLVNETQMTAFMAAFMMRRTTIDELRGFRDALMEQCIPLKLPADQAIDIVGTGGDEKDTFNISTLAAFVVAGAGLKVIKHGNYGVTSASGSSDVLEYLGYVFPVEESVLSRQLEVSGLCFLHAPLFHPAMKRVASIRRNLGLRTFFNLLGPLTNPASPRFQLLGVNSLAIARMYHYLLEDSTFRYRIIHTLDGYDEVSLTAPVKVYGPGMNQVWTVEEMGFEQLLPETLVSGRSVAAAAGIFLEVLQNKATKAQADVVVANAAMAIQCMIPQESFAECVARARVSLLSGRAYQSLKQIIQIH